jgi:hypothetical protein
METPTQKLDSYESDPLPSFWAMLLMLFAGLTGAARQYLLQPMLKIPTFRSRIFNRWRSKN